MTENSTTAGQLIRLLRKLRQVGPGQPPFEEVGLSSAQLALLEWVDAKPGCRLQDLANGLALTPPTVSVGVRKLEEAELLRRHANPEDGRAWQFEVTEAGIALLERVRRYRCDKAQHLLARLTPEEQQTLISLLGRALDMPENSKTGTD